MSNLAIADIERLFRQEYGRAVAVLVRLCGTIDAAEEAVQDAFAESRHKALLLAWARSFGRSGDGGMRALAARYFPGFPWSSFPPV